MCVLHIGNIGQLTLATYGMMLHLKERERVRPQLCGIKMVGHGWWPYS